MHKKLNPLLVQQKLKKTGMALFTPLEFRRLFGVSAYASQWFINAYVNKGLFTKLRNGLYTLTDAPRNHYLVANRLYPPSYVSFETAMSYHKLIPETIYSVTSATPKATREFESDGVAYVYRKIKRELFVGYAPVRHQGSTVLMAEPEKALMDYLYFVDLGLQSLSYERVDLKRIRKQKLYGNLKHAQRPSLIALADKLYDDQRNN